LTVGYGDQRVIADLDVAIPTGQLTVIVGPNACGKSTLLRALARMLPARTGQVELDGRAITAYPPKEVARRLGLLPQSPIAPDGIVVEDLVARGRYPHQGVLRQWSDRDQRAVDSAMSRAGVADLSDRLVGELSGGQRQRVWIALALAQQTPILLLDEPTTYLDIAHQVEVLNLARSLQREGFTVVVVLHELTLAFRYATWLIVMSQGAIVAQGPVAEVVTAELIEQVYNLPCQLIVDPVSGRPIVVPQEDDVTGNAVGAGPVGDVGTAGDGGAAGEDAR
jgi:iron complex transport system ATP-binding protein